jgi:glycosyltransferase involved in cell wall biosynthesis
MSVGGPKLSFGVPVFNGERSLPRLLDSLAAQTFEDFEVVISDNCSTDGTAELCRRRAAEDARIHFHPRPENAGIVANFNRAFDRSRGELFRWIGADDWLEPRYAELCVQKLDEHPEAIGVSTYQAHWGDDNDRDYVEYTGRRVDSPHAHERFARCLWFLKEDYRFFDPMYTMHRRRALERTRRLRAVLNGDQMLAAELSLLGPYVHVAEQLANRGKPKATRKGVLRLLRPPGEPPIDPHPEQFLRLLHELIVATPMNRRQRLACYWASLFYYWEEFETARIRPIRVVVGRTLRDWGIPMDGVSPFR